MGQRSQIYVRYKPFENDVNMVPGKRLIASYFQWNFGTRMVSRARYTMEWIKDNYKYLSKDSITKLRRILEVNFNYKDIVLSHDILEEFCDLAEESESLESWMIGQDNNDGALLIDINGKKIKYAFLTSDIHSDGVVMDAEEYLAWDLERDHDDPNYKPWREQEFLKGDVKFTERNIAKINKLATLMTDEEVEEFLSYDYEASMQLVKDSVLKKQMSA